MHKLAVIGYRKNGKPIFLIAGGAPTRLEQIDTRRTQIRTDLDALEKQLGADDIEDAQTEELQVRSDALLQEWDELTKEREPLAERAAKIASVRAAHDQARSTDGDQTDGAGNGTEGGGASNREAGFRGGAGVQLRTIKDPFADMASIRAGIVRPADLRARAVTAIEQFAKRNDHWHLEDDAAKQATNLVERGGEKFGPAVAEHMLRTGSPEYLASFDEYLKEPIGYAQRAAMSLTPANGGYLVPFTLDPTIILTNAGSANPYRRIANSRTTITNDWNGVTSAGVNAEWTAEGAAAADASPTVGPLKITPSKADAFVQGSFEVLADSDFSAQFPRLLADAKDRLEEAAFATGSGTGQPYGVVTRGTVLTLSTGHATSIDAAGVYSLMAALPARWRSPSSRNAWLGNLTTINALRNLPKFSGSTQSLVDDSGPEPSMLGKQLLESTSIASIAANAKPLVWLDGQQYYIVDRIGVSVLYEPMMKDQATGRPNGNAGWYAFWRVGADVAAATAVRVLQNSAT